MTAINAFMGAGVAHLSADTAVWGPDGRVIRFMSKLVQCAAAASVVAGSGIFMQDLLEARIRRARSLRELHDIASRFAKTNKERVTGESAWAEWVNRCAITLVGASWFEGEPAIWVINGDLGDFEPRRVGALRVSPLVDWSEAIGRPVTTGDDVAALNPQSAARAIMAAQRKQTHDTGAGPLHCVGGSCELATVSADGIAIETLHTWPDRLGERITA